MEQPKTLQTIAQEKMSPGDPTTLNTNNSQVGYEKLDAKSPNHILNVIRALKEKQSAKSIWFDFKLPSNGRAGYPDKIQLRELTTEDEKTLIKEMFSSKDNAILNIVRKCAKFEHLPEFDFEQLAVFDQDFILLELSAITFPGEKEIITTDTANHKISLKLNKEDLNLNVVPSDLEYPFKVHLGGSNLDWYLNFMTLKKVKEIDKSMKALSADVFNRLLISIAQTTEKVEMNGQSLQFDNFYEVVKLLDTLPTADLKKMIDFYNDKTGTAYGYKLSKEYYCTECGKGGVLELEPLSFFRVTL